MLEAWISLNPHRSWESRRTTLRHNIRLVAQTLFLASCITLLWYVCYTHSWPFKIARDGDYIMLTTSILICGAIFSVVAALMFTKASERNAQISRAALLKDRQEFLLLRDEKIPIRMHVVLLFFSTSILFQLFIADYTAPVIGATIVFTVSAVLVVYFIAMLEMQDVSTSPWFRERIPREWFEIKLDEEFGLTVIIETHHKKHKPPPPP